MPLMLVLAIIAMVAAAVLLGPRLRFRPEGAPPRLPDSPRQLDSWLERNEAQIPDIVAGAEKKIVWRDHTSAGRTEYSLVYIHGFSASRREVDPFPQLIADSLHANLYYARLAGHGRTDPDAMGQVEPSQWYGDALEALAVARSIGRRIVLVATSTGVTLSTVLVERFGDSIHALVAISPNYGPKNRAAWLTAGPWGRQLARLMLDDYLQWPSFNDEHERYWTTRYPGTAIATMMSLVAYGRRIDHRRLPVPLIQFSAPDDDVIDFGWSIRAFERWGTELSRPPPKELVLVHDSTDPERHVLTGAIRSPENTAHLAELAVQFVRTLK